MSGHNIRSCTMKTKYESDKQKEKQKHEHYIKTHPLSLFPDLMKEKMKIEHFDEYMYQPTNPSEHIYNQQRYVNGIHYNIGVFRWNSVEPFRKWVSVLTAYRTPSTEYGPEHPVLLDNHYPITYWISLQQETEITLKKVGVLMEVARSYEIVSKRFMKEFDTKLQYSVIADTIRTLLEMTHSLEMQIKKIQNIIQRQTTMTKLVTKTNADVLTLILSYV